MALAMNKWVLISIIVFLSSCGVPKETQRIIIVTGYDFSKYTESGFLFSPEPYTHPFDAIGLINVTVVPEVKQGSRKEDMPFDETKYIRIESRGIYWLVEKLDSKMVIEEAYRQATKMGADALVRFSIQTGTTHNGALSIPMYEVSGFAIRRK